MKTLLPVILVLSLLSGSTSFARIGETLEECQARYGTMIGTDMTRSDYPAYVFRKEDVEIRVRLYNGKSAQEIFFGIGKELTFVQIQQIRAANLNKTLPPNTTAHDETLNPHYGDAAAKRLNALGIRIGGVNIEGRDTRHPLGINGQDAKGDVLVITTAEFDRILGGMTGF